MTRSLFCRENLNKIVPGFKTIVFFPPKNHFNTKLQLYNCCNLVASVLSTFSVTHLDLLINFKNDKLAIWSAITLIAMKILSLSCTMMMQFFLISAQLVEMQLQLSFKSNSTLLGLSRLW